RHIISSVVEHSAVRKSLELLEKQGFEITRLAPQPDGSIAEADVMAALREDTCLVSLMMVQNETGAVTDIAGIAKAVKAKNPNTLIHTDAVQAFMKVPFSAKKLGVDLIAVSGHKIHAPKGIGALYIRKGLNLPPYIVGGGQEGRGIYSGTQPMPSILGFDGAMRALPDLRMQLEQTEQLRDYFVRNATTIPDVVINSGADCLPYITNLSVMGHPAQTMLNFLSERGIYVSGGSACSKGHRSTVLTAMGLEPARIDSALRISFSRFTTKEEIDMLLNGLESGATMLKKKL
ncbi:MAG TPA: cysteine desulfurase, partial [Ruminococcaceae bacterium]|nr:cysteine desulfurase [Oscillospiraceae bacterium]